MSDGATLSCSLTGYKQMVTKIIELALVAVTVNASLIELVISGFPDLQQAFKLQVEFLMSSGSWIGYLIGALYYFGLEFGYGDLMCELSGYGYVVIYYLNYAISFGQSS